METKNFFEPRETIQLIEYDEYFKLFSLLVSQKKFPKVLMLTGEKGIGKFTFLSHFLHFYFDKNNYDFKKKLITTKSSFHFQFKDNVFPNIYYLNGYDFANVKTEDIRNLKSNLAKTPLINDFRFIVLDDVETFNPNCLNALLKIIEEPNNKDHFILINNKSKDLLETINSRSINIKIILTSERRNRIINGLIKSYDQEAILDKNYIPISPGNYLKYNYFFYQKKISLNDDLKSILKIIFDLYKKEKNNIYKDLSIFMIEYYLQKKRLENLYDNYQYIKKRSLLIKNIHNFFLYKLNQNMFLNSIENNF